MNENLWKEMMVYFNFTLCHNHFLLCTKIRHGNLIINEIKVIIKSRRVRILPATLLLNIVYSSGPNFHIFVGATPKQTGRNIVLVEGVRTPFLMAGTRQVQ